MLGLANIADNFKNIRTITLTAILIALTIVGNGVTVIPIMPLLQIRFGFIFLSAIAFLFGPVPAFAAGFISGTLSFLLFPSGSYGYNPLFDLNTGLAGVIYAIFLYRKNYKSEYFVVWIVASKFVVNVICNIIINYYLLEQYFKNAAGLLTIARIFKNIVLLPGEIVLMLVIIKFVAESAYKYNFMKRPVNYIAVKKKREPNI